MPSKLFQLLRRRRTREGKALAQGHRASQRPKAQASQSSRPDIRLSGPPQDSPEGAGLEPFGERAKDRDGSRVSKLVEHPC